MQESLNVKAEPGEPYVQYRRLEKELLAVRDKIMEISGLSVCFAVGNPQRSPESFSSVLPGSWQCFTTKNDI